MSQRYSKNRLMAFGLAVSMVAVALFFGSEANAQSALAQMASPDGKPMGSVLLRQTPDGVLLEVAATGLAEGGHGFHVHETGSCNPDFKAAGDHFNPTDGGHGLVKSGRHAGDLPNIFANSDGVARADFVTTRFTLSEGETSLFDQDGSAIIIHEKPDSYQASAGAGGRVACGVVRLQDQPEKSDRMDDNFWVSASDFQCLSNMSYIGPYFVDNILGYLEEAETVARAPTGGSFPPGTVLQLVPTEAMVKHKPGWDAETNDWEFFQLDVTLGTTFVVNRGHEEVVNRANKNCFECHKKARPQWDMVCGGSNSEHGCDPIALTREQIAQVQQADPRCP